MILHEKAGLKAIPSWGHASSSVAQNPSTTWTQVPAQPRLSSTINSGCFGEKWFPVPCTQYPRHGTHRHRLFGPADSQHHGQDHARVPGGCGGEVGCCY